MAWAGLVSLFLAVALVLISVHNAVAINNEVLADIDVNGACSIEIKQLCRDIEVCEALCVSSAILYCFFAHTFQSSSQTAHDIIQQQAPVRDYSLLLLVTLQQHTIE
jgi:ABC-type protease/lipase transport system fused ATPase/permease subunit